MINLIGVCSLVMLVGEYLPAVSDKFDFEKTS